METLFVAALSNAALVAILAPLVLLVDRLGRRPALSHALWALLLLKLVTPPLFRLSLPEAERAVVPDPVRMATEAPPEPTSPISPALVAVAATARQASDAPQPGPEQVRTVPAESSVDVESLGRLVPAAGPPVLVWAGWAWLGVSLLGLVRFAVALARTGRGLRTAPAAPDDLTRRVAALAGRLGLRRAPVAHLVAGVMSPALWGLGRRARLLIPRDLWDRLDEAQRDALIVHELAHYRRGDHWVRLLELSALGLYWWFPVAWWARRALREAEEHCCDAWVVWALPEARRAYAAALLDTLDFLAEGRPGIPLLASGLGGVASIKQRLALIMRGRTARTLSWAAGAGLGAMALVVLPMAPPGRAERRDWAIESVTLGDRVGQVHTRIEDIRAQYERFRAAGGANAARVPMHLPPAAYDLALAPDGKLVAAGVSYGNGSGELGGVVVSRLHPDGTPDRGFGQGGRVATDLLPDNSFLPVRDAHVAVQRDGKIVVALSGRPRDGQGFFARFQLARFLADGRPDRSFGAGGVVETNIGREVGRPELDSIDGVVGLALQRDGKLVVAGTASSRMPGDDRFAVVRYLPDGRLDPGFGIAGRVRLDDERPRGRQRLDGMYDPSADTARALALAPDGRIFVAGTSTTGSVRPYEMFWKVAALDARGRPDPGFGRDGIALIRVAEPMRDGPGPLAPGLAFVEAAVVQPDGKLVVAGAAVQPGPATEAVAVRLDARGRLDAAFGTGGLARVPIPRQVMLHDVAHAPGGRLVLGGGLRAPDGGAGDLFLAGLTRDGRPDPQFGDAGFVRAHVPGLHAKATRLRVLPDGRLVAAGYTAVEGKGTMLVVVQFRGLARPFGLFALAGAGTLLTGLGLATTQARSRDRKEVHL
jgi:uncharacterized delta-60 repeat protein